MWKQLFQARAIGYAQVDACRLGGVNEVLAVLLLAAKHDVPVCPNAGGIGPCEYVQHLSMFDDLPEAPGYSITMKPESLARYAYPDGAAGAWAGDASGATRHAVEASAVGGSA
jgi:L-fuconate dehydratase